MSPVALLPAALATIAFLGLAPVPANAQAPPTSNETDLTVPPEWRSAPSSQPRVHAMSAGTHGAHASQRRTSTASPAAPLPSRAKAPDLPLDMGVTVRGGSATPRFTSTTGTSQAVRETGSAFGAGMRLGF